MVASFEQLFQAWKDGLDWCNAGWLQDATVQYPIRVPRTSCGGPDLAPGIHSYGPRDRHLHRYDVFCFTAALKGEWDGRAQPAVGGQHPGGLRAPLSALGTSTWSAEVGRTLMLLCTPVISCIRHFLSAYDVLGPGRGSARRRQVRYSLSSRVARSVGR